MSDLVHVKLLRHRCIFHSYVAKIFKCIKLQNVNWGWWTCTSWALPAVPNWINLYNYRLRVRRRPLLLLKAGLSPEAIAEPVTAVPVIWWGAWQIRTRSGSITIGKSSIRYACHSDPNKTFRQSLWLCLLTGGTYRYIWIHIDWSIIVTYKLQLMKSPLNLYISKNFSCCYRKVGNFMVKIDGHIFY